MFVTFFNAMEIFRLEPKRRRGEKHAWASVTVQYSLHKPQQRHSGQWTVDRSRIHERKFVEVSVQRQKLVDKGAEKRADMSADSGRFFPAAKISITFTNYLLLSLGEGGRVEVS
jgi:hypothetical protein